MSKKVDEGSLITDSMGFEDLLTSQTELVIQRTMYDSDSCCNRSKKVVKSANEYAKSYRRLSASRLFKLWNLLRGALSGSRVPDTLPILETPLLNGRTPFINGFLLNKSNYLACIASSNGSAYYSRGSLRVGVITDEFMYNIYKDAVTLVDLHPGDYRDVIDNGFVDVVFYISCWHGMENDEYSGARGRDAAAEILRYAKTKGVPTVFQSIEDPPNFETFLPVADEAEYIFTSAAEMIPKYIQETGNSHVYCLEYSVNPLLHNPIGFCKKEKLSPLFTKRGVFFAGSYMKKYAARCEAMGMIFDGVLSSGIDHLFIADRNMNYSYHKDYAFPDEYYAFTMPPLAHEELQKVHKLFDYSINLNSVTTSPTMCAMRTYEVQALGGLMLSNYSLAVSNQFPEIPIVLEESEVGRILSGHTAGEVINMQLDGIRRMFSSCTVYDRLNRVFDLCGIDFRFPERAVYVLWEGDPAEGEAALASQSLVGARLVPVSRAGELEGADGFAILWDGSGGRDYLLDMVNAFKFVDVDYVRYVELGQDGSYDYVEGGAPARNAMFDLSRVPAADVASGCAAATSGFGVVEPLPPRPVPSGPKRLGVVVPVYNNGRYLEGRCFRSLLRSSAFGDMRVYLVDDGSTDPATVEVVERLSASYPNVEAYFFGDGGSGSASRPRNKGIEMCSEPYVTFLDPDNEAINDGYALLMSELEDDASCDFAFGPILKVDGTSAQCTAVGFTFGDKVWDNPREALVQENFRPQSMQGCVFRSIFLKQSVPPLVEGGIGQDTLFSYQAMVYAERMRYVDVPIHVYYADRNGSAVNSLGVGFYRRSLIVEREQAAFMRREGLLGEYCNRRCKDFVQSWYIGKLSNVPLDEVGECSRLIEEIMDLYR